MLAWAELIPDHPVDPLDRQGIETEGQQLPVALFWRYQPRFLRRQRLVDRTLRGFDAGRMFSALPDFVWPTRPARARSGPCNAPHHEAHRALKEDFSRKIK
jgi:hypothetical protein